MANRFTAPPSFSAWRRFGRRRSALAGLGLLLALGLYVTLGAAGLARGYCASLDRHLAGPAYANCADTRLRLQPPTLAHPFGTDSVGRDILARTIYGGRVSLAVGLLAAVVSVGVGGTVGLVSGYYGGWLDLLLMRLTEAVLIVPELFIILLVVRLAGGAPGWLGAGGGVGLIVLVIGLTGWMGLARLVRAEVLALKEREFFLAARSLGAGSGRLILRHLLPNTLAPMLVAAGLAVAGAILAEATVSFLGLGIRPPAASWGNMLNDAYGRLDSAPWLWLYPGSLVVLTVLAVNAVAEGLREALQPGR